MWGAAGPPASPRRWPDKRERTDLRSVFASTISPWTLRLILKMRVTRAIRAMRRTERKEASAFSSSAAVIASRYLLVRRHGVGSAKASRAAFNLGFGQPWHDGDEVDQVRKG